MTIKGRRIKPDVGEMRTAAHVKMEDALKLLDTTGDTEPAMHLDYAIMSLGLRTDDAVKTIIESSIG